MQVYIADTIAAHFYFNDNVDPVIHQVEEKWFMGLKLVSQTCTQTWTHEVEMMKESPTNSFVQYKNVGCWLAFARNSLFTLNLISTIPKQNISVTLMCLTRL